MNRLNFTQMVNKTLLGQQENKFFNVTHIYPDSHFESERQAAKVKRAKERLNLDGKIKNIVFGVHEQLRVRQSLPSPSRVKTKSTTDKLQKKGRTQKQFSPEQKAATTQSQSGHDIDNIMCESSIPRMKVLCSGKRKERLHKTSETPSNGVSYESYRRMLLAQQRKTELESMIEEHKLLIDDRRSLEQDIFAMRHFLDDLQHRVNGSLQQLRNKKTFCECHGLLNNKNCEKCKKTK